MRDRILGAIALLWGGAILLRAWVVGGPVGTGAYREGQIAALAFAGLLAVVGGYYLIRGGGPGRSRGARAADAAITSQPGGNAYWFPARRYGWGWGPPVTWQGWVAVALWAAMVVAGLILLRHNPYGQAANIAFVIVMGGVLTLLCYWKGEPPGWRWGDRSR